MRILETISDAPSSPAEVDNFYSFFRRPTEQDQHMAAEHIKLSIDDTRALFAALIKQKGSDAPRFHIQEVAILKRWSESELCTDFYDPSIAKADLQVEARAFLSGFRALEDTLKRNDSLYLPSGMTMVQRNVDGQNITLFRVSTEQIAFVELLEFFRADPVKFVEVFDSGYNKYVATAAS